MQPIRRFFTAPKEKSFFIFGPRGTGKSTWVKDHYPDAVIIDLLERIPIEIINHTLSD